MRVQVFSRAHILQEFHLRCQSLAAKDNSGFWQKFEELNDVGKEFTTRAGNLEANREKNRYPYILPYDHSRVRLSLLDSQLHSDYINASYVPVSTLSVRLSLCLSVYSFIKSAVCLSAPQGGCTVRDFICTQGPLRSTIADFWRMVWEQNIRIIVMVTALKQKDMVLCYEYWPMEQGTVSYGVVQVTTVSRKRRPDYFITTIHLRQHGFPVERTVTHYYYAAWPDQGVPNDLASLCAFTEHVRQHLDTLPLLGPAVVHCSAGVGRSGTFVALLWLMQLCVRGIMPDVRAAVEDLRRHRVMMVQNLEQYILVHQCLMHWLSGGSVGPLRVQSHAGPAHVDQRQDHPLTSSGRSGQGNRSRGRRRRQQEQHTPHLVQTQPQTQSSVQQLLNPRNLLRRLLPPSMHINPQKHT
ncbi:receptor-type tyrosine-protein phosphatase V isoform X2 [Salmo salar]|uniref:protein-tyrosine-phosphatase n=1 Tax=Salmo salar TaxID=8030 RepID=A0A1S3LHA8_SALSA|nr:receptor-type tyrosine-protein phosphatase V-like isoform X2 [Salmo salar]|eukprot:XP_013990331.1 PREDICTED: receptor-type tyrosine-protein phosphatase V-like isoform X1 [Salmo salar]